MNVNDIALAIKTNKGASTRVLIAIEGFGGSGKSTIAKQLADILSDAYVVSFDDFIIKDKLHTTSWDDGPFDRDRLKKEVLYPFKTGEVVRYQKLIWDTGDLSEPFTIPRVTYLIVEGITSYYPSLLSFYDYKIWVDTPLDVAKQRGLLRDGSDEGLDDWNLWAANDSAYQERYHPEDKADFVIKN